jgi:hypothetical protein
MRKLIATVFNYSLDGLLADEDTEFWNFCFSLPENREPDDPAHLDFLQSAYAHVMGRTADEATGDTFNPAPTCTTSGSQASAAVAIVSQRSMLLRERTG